MKKGMFIVGAVFILNGCASTGYFTSHTGVSLVSSMNEGVLATTVSDSQKTGRACSQNILGIASIGDSSIEAAKKDGTIKSVSSVDREFLNVLFLYGRVCTIVKGN